MRATTIYGADDVSYFSYSDDGGAYGPADTHEPIERAAQQLRDQLRAQQRAHPGKPIDLIDPDGDAEAGTLSRETPASHGAEPAAAGTAWARSASSKTSTGDFPPSSSVTFFRLPAAAWMMARPVSVEPVNETLSTSGCAASAAPASSPVPVTTFTTQVVRRSELDRAMPPGSAKVTQPQRVEQMRMRFESVRRRYGL